MSISVNNYSPLSNYSALSGTGITSVNSTTFTNGSYGSSPTATYTTSGSTLFGTVDTANAGSAQTQLTAFNLAVNTQALAQTPQVNVGTGYGAVTQTFYANTNYFSTSSITFTGTTIILDAQYQSSAQFFIKAATSITFTNVPTITLINGATNANIFWIAGSGAISFSGTSPSTGIPGIYSAGTSITFANASNISGRLFAKAAITFSGISTVNGILLPNPYNGICFRYNTRIVTDNGEKEISMIDCNTDTINNQRIIAITQTASTDNDWIVFERNAFGQNKPNRDLYVTEEHKLMYRGKLIEASKIYEMEGKTNHKIRKERNGELQYNIVLKTHQLIEVHGIQCETLHPQNIMALLYTHFTESVRNTYIVNLSQSIEMGDKDEYSKIVKRIRSICSKTGKMKMKMNITNQ